MYYPASVLHTQTAVVVTIKLAELDPFGDEAQPDPNFGGSDRCRDDNPCFNSAI